MRFAAGLLVASTSMVMYDPSGTEVTSALVTFPDVAAPAAIAGRLACVVKMVVPSMLTSTTTVPPDGAVSTVARTEVMVHGAPGAL